jgi:hypothetical protein
MSGTFFAIVLAMAILSACGEITMRVRLTRKAFRDKLAWWRLGGDEVAATYEQLFPGSRLPFLRRLAFWSLVVFAAVALAMVLWKTR